MFVYHFVNSDLRFELIFRCEGKAENGGIDFEIRGIRTSTHWYWRLKKFHIELVCFFINFLATKIAFKSSFDCTFIEHCLDIVEKV